MASFLAIGDIVRLEGLTNVVFNDAVGIVTSDSEFDVTGRYTVQLQSPPTAVASYPSGVKVRSSNLIKRHICARAGCGKDGSRSSCSACKNDRYCSSDCQKQDWKIHKIFCSCNFQQILPFKKVQDLIQKLFEQVDLMKGTDAGIRILRHSLSFAEYQFGQRVVGRPFYNRGDGGEYNGGEYIDNWVDVSYRCHICYLIGEKVSAFGNKTSGGIEKDKWISALPYYNKARVILETWKLEIDKEVSQRIYLLDDVKIDTIWENLSKVESRLSFGDSILRNFVQAEDHCAKAISYARKTKSAENRSSNLYLALESKYDTLSVQNKFGEARVIIEEMYNLMAEIHSPDHPLVLTCAYKLTSNLLQIGDCFNAERYARVAYECRTQSIDPDNEDVARSAFNLTMAVHGLMFENGTESGDVVEAEMLARKALKIMERIYGSNGGLLPTYMNALAQVLQLVGSASDDEVLGLYKRCLRIHTTYKGPESTSVALSNYNLGAFYLNSATPFRGELRKEKLRLAEPYFIEAARISSKLNGNHHPETQQYLRNAQRVSLQIEFDE